MPPSDQPTPSLSIPEIVEEVGTYPQEAYHFVNAGLAYTVDKIHSQETEPQATHHVTGQQLSEGLREFALHRYGLMARTVLRRWGITRTYDFGRIVFALVEFGHMSKTDEDNIDDFRNVYEFETAFEDYRIECSHEAFGGS